jgi:hypothetical protein
VSTTEIPIEELDATGEAPSPAADEPDWQLDKQGRQYVRARGRRGIIYRSGEETVPEAFARDALPKDQRPRKTRVPKKSPPPKSIDLQELERLLAETFKAPAMPAAALLGDQWTADHFTVMGPYLARNLVVAAEHNPWLRKKLESAASGGDLAMRMVALVPLIGATFMYIVPPLVYWFNLPMPDKGREMFGIPDRKATHAPGPPPPPAAPSSPPPAA